MARVDNTTTQALADQGLNPGDNGNGNGKKSGGIFTNGWYEKFITPNEMPSAIREFLHPGKDVLELIGKTVFEDKNEAKNVIALLSTLEEFDDKEGLNQVKNLLSSFNSIGGYSRNQAGAIATGRYDGNSYYPGIKQPPADKGGNRFHRHDGDGKDGNDF